MSANEIMKMWQCFDIELIKTMSNSPLNAAMGMPTKLSTIDEMISRFM